MKRKNLRCLRRAIWIGKLIRTPVVCCVDGAELEITNRVIARLGRRRNDPLAELFAGDKDLVRLMGVLPPALVSPHGRVAVCGLAVTLPFLLELLLDVCLEPHTSKDSPALGNIVATTTLAPSELIHRLRWPRALILDLRCGSGLI